MIPFRNSSKISKSTFSFNEGLFKAIKDAPKLFWMWVFCGVESKTFLEKLRFRF